jgi:hypothetical protein
MKNLARFLTILMVLTLVGGLQVAYAQAPEPLSPLPVSPLPPKEGTVSGVISHVVQTVVGEDGVRATEGERGYLEEITSRLVFAGDLDQPVTWTQRSLLQYSDHGNWEEVQGMSDSDTDTPVYALRVTGELHRNGSKVWDNSVSSGPGTTYVSSGYSPWYSGENAFWQSKGYHVMKVTSGSQTETDYTEVSRQF